MSRKIRAHKLTAWILTLVMIMTVISGFSLTAFAAETASGNCGEELNWTLDDTGTLSISGTGNMTDYGWEENLPPWADYEIKTVVIGSGVTTIGDYAFYGCESLTSVTIPEGVETIGEAAFGDCSSLTSATIPESVKIIGEAAFIYDINLTSATIPTGVKTIEAHTFHSCSSLSSVTIPEGVENINNSAFSACKSLASITIPESVELIGDYAFYSCESLESVIIPEGVKTIGEAAFVYCGSLTSVTIPESVESIGTYAFYGCENLASVTVPGGVKTIGDEVFYDCRSLASVTLSENVETIGDNVFFGCERLLAIEVSKDNPVYTSIDGILFSKDRKTLIRYPSGKDASEYVIPDETVAIVDTAFLGCKNLLAIRVSEDNANYSSIDGVLFSKDKKTLIRCPARKDALEYVVPDGTVTISENAFSDCNSITSITIPESVTTISDEAFDDCKKLLAIEVSKDNANYSSVDGVLFSKDVKTLIKCPAGKTSEFIIPDGTVTIAGYAFENCKELTAVTIPSSVKAIAEFAFYECSSLTSIDISEGVETIGSQAFYGCIGLETVTIPSSVKFIGDCAFSDCNDIIVYIKSKEPAALGMLPFHDPTDATNITASKIIVPPDSVDAYIDEWYKYEDIIEPWSVSYIDESGDTQVCTDYSVVESNTTDWSEGWYVVTGEVTVNGGITASGDIHLILTDGSKLTVITDEQKGIYTDGNLSIYAQSDKDNMGELDVKSTSIGGCGIGAEKNLNISGGTIISEGGRFGIAAENLTISGGDIYSKSGDEHSIALYAENNVEITGGTIETTSGELGYGIYSFAGNVAISGGSVKATGDGFGIVAHGYDENDVYAENGNITISGGIVDAFTTAEGGIGIYAKGTVNIDCNEASGDSVPNPYFPGTIISGTNNGCAIYGVEGIFVGSLLVITTPEGGIVKSFSDDVESFYAVAGNDENMATNITINPVEFKNPFTDVSASDWYYEDVVYAVKNGLMKGTSEDMFSPDSAVNRAMLVTVLYRAEGEPATNRSIPFADIDMEAYYANAVIWAQQNGIVKGVSETEFAPEQNITREQIATIIYRWAVYKGMEAVTMEENLYFADSGEISEYAVSAMNWAVGSGLIKGKTETTLNPLDNATRAEIAAILHRFIEVNN